MIVLEMMKSFFYPSGEKKWGDRFKYWLKNGAEIKYGIVGKEQNDQA